MTTAPDTPTASLDQRPLGADTGIAVSPMGLGLWAVPGSQWGPAEDRDTLTAIETALDQGVNFFDTADVYGGGHSEVLLGQAMKGRRDKFTVASKIGWVDFNGEANRSQYDTVEKLVAGVESNLKRLDTDHLDAIQCHVFYEEPNTPVFIEGFAKLKQQGKVRAWGVSTSDLGLLQTFNAKGGASGGCDVLQIDYSILNRTAEAEILPFCQEHGIGVIVRGPIAMGLLADKFDASTTFPEDDFRKAWIDDADQNAQYKQDLETVANLRSAVPQDQTMAQFALRFAMSHPAVSAVIPGGRNVKQVTANTAAASFGLLSESEQAAIDAVVAPHAGRKIWPA
ncbi:MAG: aldo/keto reductase [Planctomycetota bacterium]